jgi:hypothetical protein
MFTIKLYTDHGRMKIIAAESFTILRGKDGTAEITLHQKNMTDDVRYDIRPYGPELISGPEIFQKAVIENALGKTSEIIAGPFYEAPQTSSSDVAKAA